MYLVYEKKFWYQNFFLKEDIHAQKYSKTKRNYTIYVFLLHLIVSQTTIIYSFVSKMVNGFHNPRQANMNVIITDKLSKLRTSVSELCLISHMLTYASIWQNKQIPHPNMKNNASHADDNFTSPKKLMRGPSARDDAISIVHIDADMPKCS